jgi:putative ABC transport system ATP-binding protein
VKGVFVEMILNMKNVSRDFRRGKVIVNAVADLNLEVDAGQFVSIVGHSGSGKSTLLNLAVGNLAPTSGSILFEGREIADLDDRELSLLRNEKIGYIPQGLGVLSNLNVLDNVRLPYYSFKREGNPNDEAMKLLEKVGIAHLAEAFPSSLSGGELRRVSIARALINHPVLVVADEPTSDLDEENTRQVLELFCSIVKDGIAVLMVTHESETMLHCDRILHMKNGILSA